LQDENPVTGLFDSNSKLVVDSPALVRLEGLSGAQRTLARSFLTYTDSGVNYLIQQHKKKRYWKEANPDAWQAHLDELKSQLKACILSEPEFGDPTTYSGLAEDLSQELGGVPVQRRIEYPSPSPIPWSTVPEHQARPFQKEMEAALLQARHAAVSVGTGLGKSRSIMDLLHDLGLRACVMAPSQSIARQLHREFTKHLGRKYVGLYGDGRHDVGKLITVGIGASLTRVEPGSDAWDWLSECDVFIADESHLTPARTLEKVCMRLFAKATYRFFFSATQTRMDGTEKVLKGITGPIVYEKSVRSGVDEGYLAKPMFKMLRVRSNSAYSSQDIQKLTREHLFKNADVLNKACDIANKSVKLLGQQVLILVDELDQFPMLQARLQHEVRFAHGQDNAGDAKKRLPKEFWRSDPVELVDRFNAREFPILVGTSCINTGTDIKSVETCIFLAGGKSDIAVPQSVGRTTRGGPRGVPVIRPDGRQKVACNFVDFAVQLHTEDYDDTDPENGTMSPIFRHALARAAIYKSIYPSLVWL
jgi:superfamily II DNA or RNA helicase